MLSIKAIKRELFSSIGLQAILSMKKVNNRQPIMLIGAFLHVLLEEVDTKAQAKALLCHPLPRGILMLSSRIRHLSTKHCSIDSIVIPIHSMLTQILQHLRNMKDLSFMVKISLFRPCKLWHCCQDNRSKLIGKRSIKNAVNRGEVHRPRFPRIKSGDKGVERAEQAILRGRSCLKEDKSRCWSAHDKIIRETVISWRNIL